MNRPAVDHSAAIDSERVDRVLRRPVDLDGFAVLATGETIHLKVLDLTYDGCCVEVPAQLDPGDPIKLSVLGRRAIDAQVRWCEEGRAGLSFNAAPENPEREVRPRVSERLSVNVEVVQRRPGQPKYRVRMVDISRHGCKVETVERLGVGDHLWIKFQSLEAIHAQVCWIDKFQSGLKYLHPLHPAVFELLMKRLAIS